MKTVNNKIKNAFTRWFSIDENPHKAALSYALGIFLATTPFVGTKALIALVITQLFKMKKGIAVIGVYHINSLTGPFFYAFSFYLGKTVMGYNCVFVFPKHLGFKAILSCFIGSKEIFMSLLIGGLIIGIPAAYLAYRTSVAFMQSRKNAIYTSQDIDLASN
ncbi:MAG: DUF2062 domain-containing protein [Bacteroidota bacterium]